MKETKILDQRVMGELKLLFIERDGKTFWAPAYAGNFTLDFPPELLGEYYAAFMIGILDYAVSNAPEPLQIELEERIKERFFKMVDERFDIIEKRSLPREF